MSLTIPAWLTALPGSRTSLAGVIHAAGGPGTHAEYNSGVGALLYRTFLQMGMTASTATGYFTLAHPTDPNFRGIVIAKYSAEIPELAGIGSSPGSVQYAQQFAYKLYMAWHSPTCPCTNFLPLGDGNDVKAFWATVNKGLPPEELITTVNTVAGHSYSPGPWGVLTMAAVAGMPAATFERLKSRGTLCETLRAVCIAAAGDAGVWPTWDYLPKVELLSGGIVAEDYRLFGLVARRAAELGNAIKV